MKQANIAFHISLFACIWLLGASMAHAAQTVAVNDAWMPAPGAFKSIVVAQLGIEKAAKAGYSLTYIDTKTGDVLWNEDVNPEAKIAPASTIKVLIAVAVLRQVDAGKISLDDVVTITQPNAATECRDLCSMYGYGKQVTVRQLLHNMIVLSVNTAANQLVDLVGREYVNKTAVDLGAGGVTFNKKLYAYVDAEPKLRVSNTATSKDLSHIYYELITGKRGVLSTKSRSLLVGLLGRQRFDNRLNGGFPNNMTFYHKTGATTVLSADAGFYYASPDVAVILVGLQKFRDFDSMRMIGIKTLALTRKTASLYRPTPIQVAQLDFTR